MRNNNHHSNYLVSKAFTLFINPMARHRYTTVTEKVLELISKQNNLLLMLENISGLKGEEFNEVLKKCVNIMTYSTLIGWDFGLRVNRFEAFKAAAIGATIGLCLVVGQITITLLLQKESDGIRVSNLKLKIDSSPTQHFEDNLAYA